MTTPKTVEEAFKDWEGRRAGLIKGLTTEADDMYEQCDPAKMNLCLFGKPNGEWELNLPTEKLPPKLPDPIVGINFARDGSTKKNWLKLVAIHSDAWLLAVVFYLAIMNHFDKDEREELFDMINEFPTIYQIVVAHQASNAKDIKPSEDKDEDQEDGIKDEDEDDSEDEDEASTEDEEYVEDDEDDDDDEENGEDDDDDDDDDDYDDEENGEDDDEDEENANENSCECCGRIDASNEFWICCDICETWYHAHCGNPTPIIPHHILLFTCPSCGHNIAVDITMCKYQDLPLNQRQINFMLEYFDKVLV